MPLAMPARAAPAWPMRRWLFLLLIAAPALAQTPAPAQTPAERAAALDHLLDALKAAPSAEAAAPLEQQIMQRLVQAGSPVVTLLMSRGAREMHADSAQEAIEDFSDAITLDPDLAEAYHQRAVARFAAGDTQGAIADIEQTLRHQPRDFAALRTLAAIAESRKDWKGAYAAWQKLLEIDPMTAGGEDKLKDLHRRAFGEET
jgi:tetratricopeptide (TPR) repeat protein